MIEQVPAIHIFKNQANVLWILESLDQAAYILMLEGLRNVDFATEQLESLRVTGEAMFYDLLSNHQRWWCRRVLPRLTLIARRSPVSTSTAFRTSANVPVPSLLSSVMLLWRKRASYRLTHPRIDTSRIPLRLSPACHRSSHTLSPALLPIGRYTAHRGSPVYQRDQVKSRRRAVVIYESSTSHR